MHQENKPEEETPFTLDMQVLSGLLGGFPEWFKDFFKALQNNGFVNVGTYFKTRNNDEIDNMLVHFKKAHDGELAEGKIVMLFTMLVMLAQGDGLLTNTRLMNNHVKVAGMALASMLQRKGAGTANYEEYDIDYDINRYYTPAAKGSAEVNNAS